MIEITGHRRTICPTADSQCWYTHHCGLFSALSGVCFALSGVLVCPLLGLFCPLRGLGLPSPGVCSALSGVWVCPLWGLLCHNGLASWGISLGCARTGRSRACHRDGEAPPSAIRSNGRGSERHSPNQGPRDPGCRDSRGSRCSTKGAQRRCGTDAQTGAGQCWRRRCAVCGGGGLGGAGCGKHNTHRSSARRAL